jgi:hypothetical protein
LARVRRARFGSSCSTARTLGAKILIAGGGRCNVTHFEVSADDFAGSSRPAIAKVLRAFPVEATTTSSAGSASSSCASRPASCSGYQPRAHRARRAARAVRGAGVEIAHPRRVETVERRVEGGFRVRGPGARSLRGA